VVGLCQDFNALTDNMLGGRCLKIRRRARECIGCDSRASVLRYYLTVTVSDETQIAI
jgi:hypothetical protein